MKCYFNTLLFVCVVMIGCHNQKQHQETIIINDEGVIVEEESKEVTSEEWTDIQKDTVRFKDGTVIHTFEQVSHSPFHRLTEVYNPDGLIIAQTALQYGRATDQVLLYQYDTKNRLTHIHEYPSGIANMEERDVQGIKHAIDSLLKYEIKKGTEKYEYIDYQLTYDEGNDPVSLHSDMLGIRMERNCFEPSGRYEIKVIENAEFWESDNHGGTLLVCQMWNSQNDNTDNYTGCKALAVNLKRIWCKEYQDGMLVKTTFYHRVNANNEERVHTIERKILADGSNLYTIKDKDNITTEYLWKNGFPVHCVKRSVYNTVLYEASFSLERKDIVINEFVYNYQTKKLEKQPVQYHAQSGYVEQNLMDISKMAWEEYDSDVLPPDIFMK